MPFETVDETVIRQRQIKVCRRCRGRMDEKVQNRGAWTTAGAVGGSLGTSLGGSMLLGSVLGPVGAIGGAIGGSIVGSRMGASASSTACDAIEATSDDICDRCKEEGQRKSAQRDWGGGRLGASDEPAAASSVAPVAGVAPSERRQEPTVAERLGGAASATGETLSNGWSWLSQSASSAFGGKEAEAPASGTKKATSVPFAGEGRVLGTGGPQGSARPVSRLVGGPALQAPAPAARASQMEEDEALARRLQEEFLQEDRQQPRG